ncbi:MAG: hypothetical protein OXI87_04775 [Albidovulum sp.]|nr:hypothetical protein [Albidovulum sp.]MDE0533500.1 hypothetical protein [Albidovulum sp.]
MPAGTAFALVAGALDLGPADTGPGIQPEEYDQSNCSMHRRDKIRDLDSTGSSLSLLKTVAKLHGAKEVLPKNKRSDAPSLTAARADVPGNYY